MRIAIYVLIGLLALSVIAMYSCLVRAGEADERERVMYRKWKEERDAHKRCEKDNNYAVRYGICLEHQRMKDAYAEVVRCKDCNNCDTDNYAAPSQRHHCYKLSRYVDEDFYCGYGEPKESE